jgi:hypothetical protein
MNLAVVPIINQYDCKDEVGLIKYVYLGERFYKKHNKDIDIDQLVFRACLNFTGKLRGKLDYFEVFKIA